jgi:uncharacterized membrane protein
LFELSFNQQVYYILFTNIIFLRYVCIFYYIYMTPEIEDGISKARIVALTDGIFAIVMTILVLEIVVPHLSHSEASTLLLKYLIELWPVFLSYVTSFIILGFFWIGHDEQFHYIKRVNKTLLWISIFYLMFIALIPFSTSLLGEYIDQQISVLIYGINLIIALSLNYLHWRYATIKHRLVDSDLDPIFITLVAKRHLIGIIIFMIAIIVSFVNINASIILYLFVPLYNFVMIKKHKRWFWFTNKR